MILKLHKDQCKIVDDILKEYAEYFSAVNIDGYLCRVGVGKKTNYLYVYLFEDASNLQIGYDYVMNHQKDLSKALDFTGEQNVSID